MVILDFHHIMPLMESSDTDLFWRTGNLPMTSNRTGMMSQLSHDVLMEEDQDKRVHLVPSLHVGHELFRSLAELNRATFMDSIKRGDALADSIALSIVNTIQAKGGGKLYRRKTHTKEWYEVNTPSEANDLVFRALKTMLCSSEAPLTNTPEPPRRRVTFCTDERRAATPPSPRPSITTEEAAAALLMVTGASPDQVALVHDRDRTSLVHHASFPKRPSLRTAIRTISRQQLPCPNSDFKADCPGVPLSQVRATDVLCGGSGHGALAVDHQGTQRFLSIVDAQLDEFCKADKKKQLRMAQYATEFATPRARFLAYRPSTGLWHELKREKAWFKSLRTFLHCKQQAHGKRGSISLPARSILSEQKQASTNCTDREKEMR